MNAIHLTGIAFSFFWLVWEFALFVTVKDNGFFRTVLATLFLILLIVTGEI